MRKNMRSPYSLFAAVLILASPAFSNPAKLPAWPDAPEDGSAWHIIIANMSNDNHRDMRKFYCRDADLSDAVNHGKAAPLYTISVDKKNQAVTVGDGSVRNLDIHKSSLSNYRIYSGKSQRYFPRFIVSDLKGVFEVTSHAQRGDYHAFAFTDPSKGQLIYFCDENKCAENYPNSSNLIALFDLQPKPADPSTQVKVPVPYRLYRGSNIAVVVRSTTRIYEVRKEDAVKDAYIYIRPPQAKGDAPLAAPDKTGKKPGKKTPGKDPQTDAGVPPAGASPNAITGPGKTATTKTALSAVEQGWLTKADLNKLKSSPAKAREQIAKNLPAGTADGYKKLLAAYKKADVDAYLDGLILLTAEERAALAKVPGAKPNSTAMAEYDAEMKALKPDAAGRAPLASRKKANEIVVKYRAKVPAAGPGAGPQGAGAPPQVATGPESYDEKKVKEMWATLEPNLKLLTKVDETSFRENWKGAKSKKDMTALRRLFADYRAKIENLQKCDPKPETVMSLEDFKKLDRQNPLCKEKFCDILLSKAPPPITMTKADGALKEAAIASGGVDKAAAIMAGAVGPESASVRVGPATPASTAATAKAEAAAKEQSEMARACKDFLARRSGEPYVSSTKGSKDIPNTKGSDKDTEKKEEENKHFYRDLANGTTFGLAGMVLGSFFGGPAVMLAFAIVAGGGAFALSNYLNSPKPEKKEASGGDDAEGGSGEDAG